MSASEVAVLNAKLDMVIETLAELKEQNRHFTARMNAAEGDLAILRNEHKCIQESKKDARKPWLNIIPNIVQWAIIAILSYALVTK